MFRRDALRIVEGVIKRLEDRIHDLECWQVERDRRGASAAEYWTTFNALGMERRFRREIVTRCFDVAHWKQNFQKLERVAA